MGSATFRGQGRPRTQVWAAPFIHARLRRPVENIDETSGIFYRKFYIKIKKKRIVFK